MNRLVLLLLVAVYGSFASAQSDDQKELRLNPQLETEYSESIDLSAYPFINIEKNVIEMNGDDWSPLIEQFKSATAGDSLFSIVYLGDSHVQADFNVSVFRQILQEASRPAGRGIVIPFKLAGTNEPLDYSINLDARFETSKLLKTPWQTEMPFTGIGLRPESGKYNLSVSAKTPFSQVRFFYAGNEPQFIGVSDSTIYCDEINKRLVFREPVISFSADFMSSGSTVIGGIELMNDTVGTVVHSIGNNGATYGSYLSLGDDFLEGLSELHPNLLVIALGTNEAFGRMSLEAINDNVDGLISSIKTHLPSTKILLVSPTECFKKVYRKSGKRRRRTSVQVVNTKVAEIASVLGQYAAQEGIPFYNRYVVAGETGAASKLRKAELLSRDGVHFTATGYRVWGSLLAKSVLDKISKIEEEEAEPSTE